LDARGDWTVGDDIWSPDVHVYLGWLGNLLDEHESLAISPDAPKTQNTMAWL